MKRVKQILAIIALIIIAGLYLVTIALALFGNENTFSYLIAAIIATVVFPALLWIYNFIYKLKNRDSK